MHNKGLLFYLWMTLCLLFFSLRAHADIQRNLIWALEKGNLYEVSRLLNKGADPNIPNPEGYTPLMMAAQLHNAKLAELLMDAGANIHARNRFGETAIMLASYHGQTEMVKQLYIRGAEINHSGWNPLLYAATGGHLDTIQLLLKGGADINAVSDNGSSALMMAVRNNHSDAVALLLKLGADPTIKNEQGDNALTWAEKREFQDIVKFLKNQNATK